MPMLLEPYWNVLKTPDVPLHPLSVEDYHEMIEREIITAEDRVELLEGLIVPKNGHNPPHDGPITFMQRNFQSMLPVELVVRVQMPITLDISEPEPDIAIARGPERVYYQRHPLADDLLKVVEVSETTLGKDLGVKLPMFGRNNIPIYWVLNIPDAQVEVYTDPTGPTANPGYQQRRVYCRGESVPVVVDGKEYGCIAVNDLLP